MNGNFTPAGVNWPLMSRRRYRQNCALALALDVVGERWTLLLVRELLTGPKRFRDLLANLPGIGTNLLAARLKDLEQAGLIRRGTLPPPAGSAVYELTDTGSALEPSVVALAGWGARYAGSPRKGYAYRANWVAVGMKFAFRPEAARGVQETYEYHIDGEVFHVLVEGGRCEVRQAPAPQPAFRLTSDANTLLQIANGAMPLQKAIDSGALLVEGSRQAFARSLKIFRLPVQL